MQQRPRLLRTWRGYLPKEIWFEELLNLPDAAQTAAEVVQDLPYARDYFAEFVRDCGAEGAAASGNDLEWFSRVEHRAERLWRDKQVGDDLKRLSYVLHEQDPNYRFPPDFRPDLIPSPSRPVQRLIIRQQGEMLEWVVADTPPSGSYLADCTSHNGLIQIEPIPRNAFWRSGQAPSWADDWGTDDYGHWVTFRIEGVTQKMRWIEPGTFLMGSPEDEPGRYENEGLRHPVTLTEGFWLFDTPCTQALWAVVMDENPSRFQSPTRPVEQVSWDDVQDFLQRLNGRIPDLNLVLPSEAQWEYACRAGTETAIYTGALDILGEHNAPALDAIAWYGGNSGVDFDLDDGYNSSGWPEKQYPHTQAGTRPVKRKRANPWGLYDMLGNVWEWCQDHWHDSYDGAPTDGSAWLRRDADAFRVLRGGSWDYDARDVRAACRHAGPPGDRYVSIGFRCARVQSELSQEGAEPAGPARGRQAERWPEQVPSGGATGAQPTLLRLDANLSPVRCPLPQAPAFLIRTDREHLRFRRFTQPEWANAIGRDHFGLWSEIEIDPGRGEPVIQRLRWIPPGRFWMGSPEEETRSLAKDEDEQAWFGREHPRHLVTLTEGYWLFDTPCTQALWEAVMEKNPSEFQSPTRPVEKVSWNDVQDFLKRLNGRIPDLNLVLPSEAQWEYACRAGTETAIYTGALDILGERNAPALDAIAWYGGNSGVDFDLGDGYDSSDWPEKQYPHTQAGTRPVKCKQANPWGLYDMLGNVWEWCQDGVRKYDGQAQTNPLGSLEADAYRVLRGGSWSYLARFVRAAYRCANPPVYRIVYIGFRCARVQSEQSQLTGRSDAPVTGDGPASGAPGRQGGGTRSERPAQGRRSTKTKRKK